MSEAVAAHWSGASAGPGWEAALSQIEEGFSALAALNPGFLDAEEKKTVLGRLRRLAARQAAVELAVIAASSDVADAAGDRDITGWMSRELRIDRHVARAQARLADDLENRWIRVAAALTDGAVSADQARAIVTGLNRLGGDPHVTPEHLAKAEELLLDEAHVLPPRQLARAAEHILRVIDPDHFDDADAQRLAREEEAAQQRTWLTSRDHGDGTMRFQIQMPLADGARLKTYLEAIAQPRKQNLEAQGQKQPWERLMGQAFTQLIGKIDPTTLPHHGGDATTVMVTMSLSELRTEIGTAAIGFEGEQITAAEARKLACNAQIIPAVLGTHGEVLDLGRASRLATPTQRKALWLRFKTCCAEDCDTPAPWSDVHHLDPWSAGGKTDLNDMVIACSHHHRLFHSPSHTHERLPDGSYRFTRRT